LTRSLLELDTVVREAWLAALAPRSIDLSLSWEEVGADSLHALRLLLRLEQVLGRKLSFDIIDPDMTIGSLASALMLRDIPKAAVGEAPGATVFLVPGIFGDEPILAEFRRWFGSKLHFEVIDLPNLQEPAAIHLSLPRTGGAVAQEIERRRPRGKLMIAGYSFGGQAAYEAARLLIAGGHEVALLCILDAAFHDENKRIVGEAGHLSKALAWTVIRLIAHSDKLRRLMLAASKPARPSLRIWVQQLFLRALRVHAVKWWQPSSLAVQALLVVSAESEHSTLAGWLRLLPGAEVVRTLGGHRDVFRSSAMARLGPALLNATDRHSPRDE
jgi:thioesterase domain-containing protein/acyl carrier protein